MVEYSFPKADGDILFASEVNSNWYFGQSGIANAMRVQNSNTDFVRTVNNAFASSAGLTLVNTAYDSVADTIRLIPDPDGTPTENADFTGGSMDSDWTLTGSNGATTTFDAANNEVDCATGTSSGSSDAKVEYNVSNPSNGAFKLHFSNLNLLTGGEDNSTIIAAFGVSMTISSSASNTLSDNTSGATTIALGSNVRLRISRSGGWVRTEYSPEAESWTTLNEVTDFSAGVGTVAVIFRKQSGAVNHSGSIDLLTIYDEVYESSGTMTTGSTATGTTAAIGFISYEATTAGTSSIQAALSSNGGSNFTNVANDGPIQIGTTSTNFQTRFTLTSGTAGVDTPILSWFSSTYGF